MNVRSRVARFGLLPGVLCAALALVSWNSSIAAPPGQSGSTNQQGSHHTDPEIHRALHTLREARHELEHAKHDFDGHREAALHAVDDAIHQLEVCLKTTQNGGSSSNGSQSGSSSAASQWRQNHTRLTSGS